MKEDLNIMQVLSVKINDNEMVFMAKIIPHPLFLVPLFLADNTPKKALSMYHPFYDTFL